MYQKIIDNFDTVQLIKDNVMVELDWLEDGVSGEYRADDSNDVPLLRFTVCSCPYVDTASRYWEPVSNASYVTQIPIDTPRAVLEKLAQKIMDKVYDEIQAGNSIKEICEELSGIQNEGCPKCGSEEGYTGRLLEYHSARFDHKGNWVEDLGCDDSKPYGGPYTCCACDAEFDELPGK